jgi:hypothetical protein
MAPKEASSSSGDAEDGNHEVCAPDGASASARAGETANPRFTAAAFRKKKTKK